MLPRPAVNPELCAGCGLCEESCPQGAIRLRRATAVVDLNLCIRCWCCNEVCPQGAVELSRSRLGACWPAPDADPPRRGEAFFPIQPFLLFLCFKKISRKKRNFCLNY
jgi:Fe-S-cluster-containing hydrogenase component 2